MPRNCISVGEPFYEQLAYLDFMSGGTNKGDIKRMKTILRRAITTELTDPQRYCLTEYYIHGRKMKEIAASLEVNPSTVTRHIKRATEKLRHIADYY